MSEEFYESRPIKSRRTKTEIETIKTIIYNILADENPMTVRQVFYRLVTLNAIKKSEKEYKSTVVRLLSEMRRQREIPFQWISDNTRWMRKLDTYDCLEDALFATSQTYRRSLWSTADCYVEVWLEKEALAGVLVPVTQEWDVPLLVTRGYPSLSFLHSAASAIASQSKTAYIYYLGDQDPSGVDIPRVVDRDIRAFAPEVELHFLRIAVTPEQISRWNLPTRPTKVTDSRSQNFVGESTEVDAIPPAQLRALVKFHIEQHLCHEEIGRLERVEKQERETLERVAWSFKYPGQPIGFNAED